MAGSSFQFRLERVRALRERKKDIARQDLALALGKLSDSESRLRSAEMRLEQARAEQRSDTRTLSGPELLARQTFLEQVEQQRSIDVQQLARSEGEVADRDIALGIAAREHEMLERLKEKQRLAHDHEARRKEDETLDEIALDRHRRRVA